MEIITYAEITEQLQNCYNDNGYKIIGKHDIYSGEENFALCVLEQTIGLLDRSIKNDQFLIQYLQGLMNLSRSGSSYYRSILDALSTSVDREEQALRGSCLADHDKNMLKEIAHSCLSEYTTKGEYQSCCYSAIQAFLITAYCIILKKIDYNIGSIDIIVDLDDKVQSINVGKQKNNCANIIVQWHSTNVINSMYLLYKSKYIGLDDASILALVAADVIEKNYYSKDMRFSEAVLLHYRT